jgi:hypothetical protein
MKINLFLSYYHNVNRDREFMFCLKKNIANTYIDKIYVYCEDDLHINDTKLVKIKSENPFFSDFFSEFVRDSINIISNTDIYFDSSLRHALEIKQDQVFCLSRREVDMGLKFRIFKRNIGNSQDTWIFHGIPEKDVIMNSKFRLGKPGCDNHLAWLLAHWGYKVYNPAYLIKAVHVHKSKSRSYSEQDRIPGEYRFVPPAMFFKFNLSERITFMMNVLYEKCFR